MNRLSLMLVILGLLSFESVTLAQKEQISAVAEPCGVTDSPGRPTLKRRLPTSDDRNSASDAAERVETTKPCDPGSKADSTDNQEIARIRFEGLKSISESDLLWSFRDKRIQLPKDPTLEPDRVHEAEAAIKEFLTARGYMHPTVYSRVDKIEGTSNALTFVVNEGPRPGIGEIRFQGNRVFSSQLLAAKMKEHLARFERTGHQGYDAYIFSYCLHSLTNFVRSEGYLQASFRDPKIEEVADGLIITLQMEEGVLYRLGKIEIEGANAVSPQRIREMLDLQKGDVTNGAKISSWLFQELKEVYGELGFIRYTAECEAEFILKPDRSEGVVDFKVLVDEGPRFKVYRIKFEGEGVPEEQLQQLLLIREGDVFNQRLYEASIKKVNETGLFEFVDKDRDVNFGTNEEEGLVDIVIKVARKAN